MITSNVETDMSTCSDKDDAHFVPIYIVLFIPWFIVKYAFCFGDGYQLSPVLCCFINTFSLIKIHSECLY